MYRQTFKMCIENGVNIDHQDIDGITALHMAVKKNNLYMVKKLLSLDCKTDLKDSAGKKPIDYAKEKTTIAEILRTAEYTPKPPKPSRPAKPSNPKPAQPVATDPIIEIKKAIQAGDLEKLPVLISQADVNKALDCNGTTPLLLAIVQAQVDCVTYLLNKGASPTQQTTSGENAWDFALQQTKEHPELLLTLLDYQTLEGIDCIDSNGNSVLHKAVARGSHEALTLMAENNIEKLRRYIESYNSAGNTPLIMAIKKQDSRLINILLDRYGADVNKPGKDGLYPIFHALIANKIDIVNLLIAQGADATRTDRSGNTSLHYAAAYSTQDKIIDLLIGSGCSIEAQNHSGQKACELSTLGDKKPTARISSYLAQLLEKKLRERTKRDKQEPRQKTPVAASAASVLPTHHYANAIKKLSNSLNYTTNYHDSSCNCILNA